MKLNRVVSARSCGLASAIVCLPAFYVGNAMAQQSSGSVPLPAMTVEAGQPKKQKKKAATKKAPATVPPSSTSQVARSAPATTSYQDTTGSVDGYVATDSASATKTGTPLIETPQTVNVITSDQIEAQGATSVSEALRYTPGVVPEYRPTTRWPAPRSDTKC